MNYEHLMIFSIETPDEEFALAVEIISRVTGSPPRKLAYENRKTMLNRGRMAKYMTFEVNISEEAMDHLRDELQALPSLLRSITTPQGSYHRPMAGDNVLAFVQKPIARE